jgi:pyrroloquinoline quinone (PQQ) biosynthesis protein C
MLQYHESSATSQVYHRYQEEARRLYAGVDLEHARPLFPPPPAQRMEPVKFVDELADTVLRHHPIIQHPFLARLIRGLLSREELQAMVKIHYPQLVQVLRNDAMIVATSRSLEEMRKQMLVLIEEAGEDLAGGQYPAHPQLWLRLGTYLGLKEKEIEEAPVHPHYQIEVLQARLNALQTRIGAEAPANSRMGERVFSIVFPLWAEALKSHYGLPQEALAFFEAHGEADWGHGQIGKELLVPYVQTAEQQRAAWLKERREIFKFWDRYDAWAEAPAFYRRKAAQGWEA